MVLVVPPAEPVLTAVKQRYPEAVREGVPAHVSLLYPFLPADEIYDGVLNALSEIVATTEPLTVFFGECYRKDEFVALRPDPISGVRALGDAVQRRWPHLVPYAGRFGEPEPHVTVALHTTAERAFVVADEIVPPHLPIEARLSDVWLVVYTGDRWTVRRKFALGTG